MKNLLLSPILTGLTLLFAQNAEADGVKPSVWVYPDSTYGPNLLYGTDTNGVRINDFSECGYQRGLVELPNVTNLVEQSRWIYLTPIAGGGDDGLAINAALNALGAISNNANGFRGVVFLGPGTYHISSTNAIVMRNDGVVLKGSGSSSSTGTVLYAETLTPYNLITVQGDFSSRVGDSNNFFYTNVSAVMVEPVVPAGTRTFRVSGTAGFHVGDHVQVARPVLWDWVHALDMDQLYNTWLGIGADSGIYERVIQRIEGNWLTVDTPLPQTFWLQYMNGIVQPFAWDGNGRVQNCGVEDLSVWSNYHDDPLAGEQLDMDHALSAVTFSAVENGWARNVVAHNFGSDTFHVMNECKCVTIAECQNLTPVGFLQPPSGVIIPCRYSFHLESQSQYVLVRDCYANDARHDYVLSDRVPGPNAFVRCATDNAHAESGPHERWSTGALFDDVSSNGNEIQASNLGNGGTSGSGSSAHGWAGAYMVFWNCFVDYGDIFNRNRFRVRNPPTALNWLIGSNGHTERSKFGCGFWDPDGPCWSVGADPDGTYDQSGADAPPVQLHSLYYAQLQQRLLYPGSQFREYRLGDIDQFSFTPGVDDRIPVDTNWMAQVQQSYNQGTVPGPTVTNLFDSAGPNQATAFTFYVPSYSNEQVVAASLTLSLHFSAIGTTFGHELLIGMTTNGYGIDSLGWTNVSTSGTYARTIPIDPALVNAGELNLALSPNCGVDFAVLNLQVAPMILTVPEYPSYSYNTFVQAGSNADQNLSGSTELLVKVDPTPDFQRRTFLTWYVIETSGTLVDARVQLYCKEADEAGNEQSAAVVPDNSSWNTFSVTWNTQPATSPPFAYWVPQPGQFSQFDVTPQVAAALAGATKEISFCIDSAADWGSQGGVAYASSQDPDSTHHPQLILRFSNSNSPPVIIGPANQLMGFNQLLTLPVTVGDAETSASSLTLTASSSVPSEVSVTNISGAGSNRTVSLHSRLGPGRHQKAIPGKSVITLQVNDGSLSASTSFVVSVDDQHTSPVISQIADQAMAENAVLYVPFAVSDEYNVPNNLSITFSNSNSQLFPSGASQLLPPPDSTGNRTLVFTPASNLWGSNTITIHVDNGFYSTDQTFSLLVIHVNQPPTYARIISPNSGDNFLPGASVPITAQAFDPDSNLDHIQFFSQAVTSGQLPQLMGTSSNAPFSVTWTNAALGVYTLYAIAYDTTGLSATSPPVSLSISVPLVPQPQLFIAPATNNLAVGWSTSLSSNILQSTTNLAPPVIWTPVTVAPLEDDSDSTWVYFFSPTEPRRFFRLSK